MDEQVSVEVELGKLLWNRESESSITEFWRALVFLFVVVVH